VHNNYYYIRQLSAQLLSTLQGWALATCFSQEKDELVIGFTNGSAEFYIKAVLTPGFACFVFPETFARARKNSVELFEELIGLSINGVTQFLNERSFSVDFENDFRLLFKMHGNRSNIILFQKEEPFSLFHNKLGGDYEIKLEQLHRPLDQSFEAFVGNNYQIQALFPTFGKPVLQYIQAHTYQQASPEEKWEIIQQVLAQLKNPVFYISQADVVPVLSLLPVENVVHTTKSAIEAANLFYSLYAKVHTLAAEKEEAIRLLTKRKAQTENYLSKTYDKLAELEEASKNEHVANILMANLHQIPARAEKVELLDFYHNQPITIKLKKDLSPQRNAEVYYRKAKNEKIEVGKIQEAIESKEQELQTLLTHIQAIREIKQLKELRTYLKTHGISSEKAQPTPDQLFKKTEFLGYEIWIGRNAKNNDLLTQKYAFKEDLWLHAKDVTGSHVIVKYQAGKNFPEPVIERAAGLAAYFSKLRTDTLCPVIYTPKKYVRKLKGLPEGAVVIDKEKVMMVEPFPLK
jgi:predicted ribosome quality control (RQC) complex YloA/Tae2 family protein